MEENDLLAFIQDELPRGRSGTKLEAEDDLLGSGLVDSLGVMRIVAFIEERFGAAVPPEDLRIEHFLTVQKIMDYLAPRRTGNAA